MSRPAPPLGRSPAPRPAATRDADMFTVFSGKRPPPPAPTTPTPTTPAAASRWWRGGKVRVRERRRRHRRPAAPRGRLRLCGLPSSLLPRGEATGQESHREEPSVSSARVQPTPPPTPPPTTLSSCAPRPRLTPASGPGRDVR